MSRFRASATCIELGNGAFNVPLSTTGGRSAVGSLPRIKLPPSTSICSFFFVQSIDCHQVRPRLSSKK